MSKQQIYKMVVTALGLRLRTIRDKVVHGIFRLALRFPQKCKIFVGPILVAIVTCVAIALGLSSCNVTRTITTKSEYWQKADTSVVIQTRTIESYDGTRK